MKWEEARFKRSRNFWSSPKNRIEFFERLAKHLNISDLSVWYHVDVRTIKAAGGTSLINRFKGSLIAALQSSYPDYRWTRWSYYKPHQTNRIPKTQWILQNFVEQIFPGATVFVNYKHPELKDNFEFDLYLPELSLAFEYQGEIHYVPVSIYDGLLAKAERDRRKVKYAQDIGATLICIPYWWDRTPASLVKQIKEARPDLHDLQTPHSNFIPQALKVITPKEPTYRSNTSKSYNEKIVWEILKK